MARTTRDGQHRQTEIGLLHHSAGQTVQAGFLHIHQQLSSAASRESVVGDGLEPADRRPAPD